MKILQVCFRDELRQELIGAQQNDPKYSLRAFARALHISSGTLSDYLKGKRAFSPDKVASIVSKAGFPFEKTRALLGRIFEERELNRDAVFDFYPMRERKTIDHDHYSMISDWYNFALLSLSETQGFRSDPAWIAERLGIDLVVAEAAVERLLRLELLSGTKDEIKPTGKSFITTDGIASKALRHSHIENLKLAKRSLDQDKLEDRDFLSVTLAIDPTKLAEAKRRTRVFLESLSDLLESGTQEEVYQAQIQLFPLSRAAKALEAEDA